MPCGRGLTERQFYRFAYRHISGNEESMMQGNFTVLTGRVPFQVVESSALAAITHVKGLIQARGLKRIGDLWLPDEKIGVSLVTALAEGRLHFLVVNQARTQAFGGEHHGEFQDPVSWALIRAFREFLHPQLCGRARRDEFLGMVDLGISG